MFNVVVHGMESLYCLVEGIVANAGTSAAVYGNEFEWRAIVREGSWRWDNPWGRGWRRHECGHRCAVRRRDNAWRGTRG